MATGIAGWHMALHSGVFVVALFGNRADYIQFLFFFRFAHIRWYAQFSRLRISFAYTHLFMSFIVYDYVI